MSPPSGADRPGVPDDVVAAARDADLGAYEWTWTGRRSLLGRPPAPVVRVFGAGLVVDAARNDRPDVYHWAMCHLTYRREHGRLGTTLHVTVRHEDGPTLRIRGGGPVVEPLLTRLVAGVTQAQLPRARAALDTGGSLDFGRVRVDRRFLHLRNRSLRWSEVAGVRNGDESVTVAREGKVLPYVILSSDTSDFHVLQGIAEELWRGGRAASPEAVPPD